MTPTGRKTVKTLNEITVMKSEFVRSYKRTRAKETDHFGEYQPFDWGAMTTTSGDQKTIHMPGRFSDQEAARLFTHEGEHARGGDEQKAYTCETQWAIEASENPRAGFTKKEGAKTVPDPDAIKKFVVENYKGWYKPDPNVQWKRDKDSIVVDYGKDEEQKGWVCPC